MRNIFCNPSITRPMQLELKQPVQTLNSTYRRANLGLTQATTFKKNLSKLLEGINDKETEENQKNIVIEFLKNTYYKDLNEVNTKGRQDLVIHNDKTAKSSVGVIIEVKRTSNKAEMISAENPNAKALQELLHYYLKERFISNNKEIKHLIITNIYEWYVFDAADFERFFFEDKKLKEDYKNWTEGKLGLNTTDWFYKEIAKPFLEDKTLECTYFDIRKLKDVVNNDLPLERQDEMLLVDTYKMFSPEYLLKLSFQNDANTLNTAFYNELLHILGLEETGTSKKIITRIINEKDRNNGSLLERIINSLDRNSSYEQYPNIKEFGETHEEQLFSFALELCITWLNRILFLKLLEGQLLKYHQKDPQQKFLNSSKIENFSMLDTLFFEILAVPVADREQDIAGKFANIPYLNSSLFDKTELENVLQISLLERNLTMSIFNATVLKDDNGKRIVGQKSTLQYLFEFLDAFDFASDADVVIQENDKTIINSAVLGLIFEKLNGYKDGSVFTPSFITMYMCREGIRKAVIQKFNDQYDWNCKNFNDLQNRIDDITKKQANDTFNKLRICDPAVGSGHFLVSALNEIIVIKHELKILIDKKGKRLREHHISTENDELVIINKENGKNFVYDYRDDEKQEVQELLFNEKQIIIENCLFGVDINAKSVLICRLRLWIELLKNMYYTQESKFKQLETFPNIDINIKTGNSLISKFNLDDKMNDFAPAARQYIKKIIPDYKIQVDLYKSVRDKGAKNIIIKKIKEYKANFSKMFNPKDKDFRAWKDKENEWFVSANSAFLEYELTSKLLEESNALKAVYENKMAIYKNAFEWRFEFPEVLNDDGDFIGFDLVVGNPPYFSVSNAEALRPMSHKYMTWASSGDIYALFYELGQWILKPKGYEILITSNKWLRASYGASMRNYIITETNPLLLVDFGQNLLFDRAIVHTNIIMSRKELNQNQMEAVRFEDGKFFEYVKVLGEYVDTHKTLNNQTDAGIWNLISPFQISLQEKIEANETHKKLRNWDIKINFGLKTGFNEAFIINESEKDALIKADSKNIEIIKPILRGRDTRKYYCNFAKYYIINTYNGYMDLIKETHKNIVKLPNDLFKYKSFKTKKWKTVKRLEATKGNKFRVNRVIVKTDYPTIETHLKKFEMQLKAREDQGEDWTNLRNCAYIDEFVKPKIIFSEITSEPQFYYDEKGYYPEATVFFISGKNLKYLTALLNSKPVTFFFKSFYMGGELVGKIRYKKVFLEQIPIPTPTEIQEKAIVTLVDAIISQKAAGLDSLENERKIDALVYDLYEITAEEQKIIEGK